MTTIARRTCASCKTDMTVIEPGQTAHPCCAETPSTSTTDIARAHGWTGPTCCQDCGTTESVHFGSWFDPKTGESGDFIRCCACDVVAGAPADVHDDCAEVAGETTR